MDNRVGAQPVDRAQQAVTVQCICHHGLSADGGDLVGTRAGMGQPEHLMTMGDELADKGRPDRAACASEQYFHGFLLRVCA